MNIEQLSLQSISKEEMVLINGGTEETLIDTSSTAYQLGNTLGQAVRNAAAAWGLYTLFFL
ncbi:MAG: hypothetical protein HY015_07815 [Bacteroidetes bacterium]|nr:hypothetical protein [Bacteroidota bacterium]MBI3482865.1 hypothetical protein [Bacteroidota bacterium]